MTNDTTPVWEPDVLGDGWECTTLDLGHDEEGPLVATVVRQSPGSAPVGGPAILHVHGFNDYFFQTHVAEAARAHGYAWYAVDLRRAGRSLRPWQTPHFCTDLAEYDADLDAAAALVRAAGHSHLLLHGHSTGGLVAALWADRRRGADALVLNSPWFDLNARWFRRVVSSRVLHLTAPWSPRRVLADGPSAYARHLHVGTGGLWEYDLTLKPASGFPVRAGWLRAVRLGHARLGRGLAIDVPVLVCTSASSGPNRVDNPDLNRQDTVLDVRQIWRRAGRLGQHVEVVRVDGGIHDLTLSAEPARSTYLTTVFSWLSTVLGDVPPLTTTGRVGEGRHDALPTIGEP